MTPFGALRDLRIIDLTQMLAGPYATMILADHGAQIIKIEAPDGDMARHVGPFRADDTQRVLGGYFQSIDRNKQSVCLDLKTQPGRTALKALIRDADAVVENFRSGVMERLDLGYETLRAENPRLVYGALRGFGDPRTGRSPYSDWPAFDVIAQAMGGIMAITGPDPATPTKIGPGIGDIVPGIMLAFGVLAAIHSAKQTGTGQFVDVAMVDSVLAISERSVWQYSCNGIAPGPEGNHHPIFCPFGIFPASDGFVTVAAQQDGFFAILCTAIGANDLADDARFTNAAARAAHRTELIEALSAHTARLTRAELTARLGGRIPFGPVMDIADIAIDPHFAARDMLVDIEQPGSAPLRVAGVPIKMTETPGGVHRRSPLLGEHTEQRLREAGLSTAEIAVITAGRAGGA